MKTLVYGLLLLCISISGCSHKSSDVSTFLMEASNKNIDEFLTLYEVHNDKLNGNDWFRVSPSNIVEQYGLEIFKSESTCESYLMFEENIYLLGDYFGGYGVTSFAIADINLDDNIELYFTYSWGSGLHRSLVGYFDTKSKKIYQLDYVNYNNGSLLKVDDGSLCIYDARTKSTSFVDIELEAIEKLTTITLNTNNDISLEEGVFHKMLSRDSSEFEIKLEGTTSIDEVNDKKTIIKLVDT